MSYDTKILLIILLIVTLMFGGASLYAYFKMDDSNSEDVLWFVNLSNAKMRWQFLVFIKAYQIGFNIVHDVFALCCQVNELLQKYALMWSR